MINSNKISNTWKTELRLLSRTKKQLYFKSKIERTRKFLSSIRKLKIKILKIAIDMNSYLRQRKKWRDSTKIKLNKCVKVMSLRWKEEDKTTEINKKLILKDLMSYKHKKMKSQESLKRDWMSWVFIMRKSSRSLSKISKSN